MTIGDASSLHVVARFADGAILKGTTRDFSPNKPDFHVYPDGDLRAGTVKVPLAQLKAVFFVKSLEGNKDHVESHEATGGQGQGRTIRVTFKDGEVLTGITVGYAPDRPGFFFVPFDPQSNNLRIFVVRAWLAKVEFLPGARTA
ncbi:MAG TPA: hypothetical protein VFE84_12430 [Patescibacteria group bacterium]|nr:hypothetical protein [Patescibacteria group bacterium]